MSIEVNVNELKASVIEGELNSPNETAMNEITSLHQIKSNEI